MIDYVHGYSKKETSRLFDQANALAELLHRDTCYKKNSLVLEAGCGVGAQTVMLAKSSPEARIMAMDISKESLKKAKALISKQRISNVTFVQGDIYNCSFKKESFDHIFVCFVLEHLKSPLAALKKLRTLLKPGGTITVIEGDHGSAYYYPQSKLAQKTIQCLIDMQAKAKGNALIGRQVFPLLQKAGFINPEVSPRMVYVDASKPHLVKGFTKETFIAMVKAVKEQALSFKLIDKQSWDKGIRDLARTTRKGGTFCYTFFKAIAIK